MKHGSFSRLTPLMAAGSVALLLSDKPVARSGEGAEGKRAVVAAATRAEIKDIVPIALVEGGDRGRGTDVAVNVRGSGITDMDDHGNGGSDRGVDGNEGTEYEMTQAEWDYVRPIIDQAQSNLGSQNPDSNIHFFQVPGNESCPIVRIRLSVQLLVELINVTSNIDLDEEIEAGAIPGQKRALKRDGRTARDFLEMRQAGDGKRGRQFEGAAPATCGEGGGDGKNVKEKAKCLLDQLLQRLQALQKDTCARPDDSPRADLSQDSEVRRLITECIKLLHGAIMANDNPVDSAEYRQAQAMILKAANQARTRIELEEGVRQAVEVLARPSVRETMEKLRRGEVPPGVIVD